MTKNLFHEKGDKKKKMQTERCQLKPRPWIQHLSQACVFPINKCALEEDVLEDFFHDLFPPWQRCQESRTCVLVSTAANVVLCMQRMLHTKKKMFKTCNKAKLKAILCLKHSTNQSPAPKHCAKRFVELWCLVRLTDCVQVTTVSSCLHGNKHPVECGL